MGVYIPMTELGGNNPMAEASFDVFCPECNMLVEAKAVAEGHSRPVPQGTVALVVDDIDKPYRCEHYSVCLCPRCQQPFFVNQSLYGVAGEFEAITDQVVLYPGEPKLLSEALPDSVKTAYDQAARCLTASLFEPCVLMSRKCLEAVCKTLNANGRSLHARLANLHEAEHIDSRLLDWAHQVRVIGNEAAHDVDAPVTKEDARDAFEFTEAILIYVFSLAKRFEALRERRATAGARTDGNA